LLQAFLILVIHCPEIGKETLFVGTKK